jgi:hypothetical protein
MLWAKGCPSFPSKLIEGNMIIVQKLGVGGKRDLGRTMCGYYDNIKIDRNKMSCNG